MSSQTHATFLADRFGRVTKWPWLCGLLGLMLARAVWATDSVYPNDAVNFYIIPGNPPPNIDATNFVNTSTFSYVNNANGSLLYEPWNVCNYVNSGLMSGTPGFQFDTLTTNVIPHQMAGSLDNSGEIDCGYRLVVWATNIVSPGTIAMGSGALGAQFTGGSVDLSHGTISMVGVGIFGGGQSGNGNDWGVGTDTNGEWLPGASLTPTTARSSLYGTHFSPKYVNYTYLTNSTPYFNIQGVGTSNVIYRAIFFQDQSLANVAHNVYYGDYNSVLVGSGDDTIEWIGTYTDPATGTIFTNYLYLNGVTDISTNTAVNPITDVPDNLTFMASPVPLFTNAPAVSNFISGLFGTSTVTNLFSYGDVQLISTTTATNASYSNPSGAFTNLPGCIYITAGNELNLNLATITGPNYLAIMATNLDQFDGSAGANIVAPYSDISLGVTNGYLTVSNLMQAAMPNWSGTVKAWTGRWLLVDTNGVTNDFRIFMVNSQVAPTTLSQVQHLTLHGNNVVISDALNVLNSLNIDAQNLTLTTNIPGNGATSTDGELNLQSSAIVWASSLPNLLNLTNYGVIQTQNLITFGSAPPAVYITNNAPGTPAVPATATLFETFLGNNVTANNRVTIGTNNIYTFVNAITNKVLNQVKIAATFDASMSNLIAAINHAAGAGTNYSTNGIANKLVTAGVLTNHSFTVTARTNGLSGNLIVVISSTTNLNWNGSLSSTLSGGVDNVVRASGPYDNFINHGRISNQGATIYAGYFESDGPFSCGNATGSFTLQSTSTVLTNGSIIAGGDVSITTGSLVVSNLFLSAGRSLKLQVTNLLTDTGAINPNVWSVGGSSFVGLNLPIKPPSGDLLGTTISCTVVTNKQVVNTWAGANYGVSTLGYTNNEAIGVLILDARGANSTFRFNGTLPGKTNGLYVDELVLLDNATNFNGTLAGALSISNNLVIYYAQAMINGVSVAEKLNGLNSGHLRWVPQYAGNFSSFSIVYPDGKTYAFNAALAQSRDIDSDGDGTYNYYDPTPFFVPSQMKFAWSTTNQPASLTSVLKWQSLSGSTNYVLFTTNLLSGNWRTLTNVSPFVATNSTRLVTNTVTLTNMVNYPAPSSTRFYRVRMDQPSTQLYGPGF